MDKAYPGLPWKRLEKSKINIILKPVKDIS
jgi:hypothetical protein